MLSPWLESHAGWFTALFHVVQATPLDGRIVIFAFFQKVHKSPRGIRQLAQGHTLWLLMLGAVDLQVSSPSLYRAENCSWESASIPNTQHPFLPVYPSFWDKKVYYEQGRMCRACLDAVRADRVGLILCSPLLFASPVQLRLNQGETSQFFFFFFY